LDQIGVTYEADAGLRLIQTDQPEPSFAGHDDAGMTVLVAGQALDAIEMLEVRDLVQARISHRAAEAEMASDDGAVTGGIQEIFRFDRLAVIQLHRDIVGGELDD